MIFRRSPYFLFCIIITDLKYRETTIPTTVWKDSYIFFHGDLGIPM